MVCFVVVLYVSPDRRRKQQVKNLLFELRASEILTRSDDANGVDLRFIRLIIEAADTDIVVRVGVKGE